MARSWLNLGILAHVDAGKTTLTERLLYEAGVIDAVGSVDRGTTQTDTLALERRRGITIKAAVVSFALGETTVNLIDTPGHPDFIAEVERALAVLDGAVLVVSAVEGVQPQTRILMRALQRLRIPTLLFVNKIDRAGADGQRVLGEIAARLTPDALPLPENLELARSFTAEIAAAEVHPLLYGSARTGAGIPELMALLPELLPVASGDAAAEPDGAVFKIDRGPGGEKVAFVRMFSGTIRTRDRVAYGPEGEAKVTALAAFERGGAAQVDHVEAGQIGKLWGLAEVRIGDRVGRPGTLAAHEFAAPAFEAVIVPRDPGDGHALSVALAQLAEQDPLIDVRQDDGVLSVSLYGEVQKEVIEATLADDYGLAVEFAETTAIHVERPLGTGEALELLGAKTNPFAATIGLRVERGGDETGVRFECAVPHGSIPLYVYKRAGDFVDQMTAYVRDELRRGLFGWKVTDCVVTLVECGYAAPATTAGDVRKLTALVLRRALQLAGTRVFEPLVHVELDVPQGSIGAVVAAVARLGASSAGVGGSTTVEAVLPAAQLNGLQRLLPGLTGGEGVLESALAGYRPVAGEPPQRPTKGKLSELRTP